MNFDYLDYNNGVLLKIIHSGTSSEDVEVVGKVKGFGKIVNKGTYIFENFSVHMLKSANNDKEKQFLNKKAALIIYIVMVLMCIGMMAMFKFRFIFINTIMSIIGGITLVQVLILLFYNPIPDGFEVLEDEQINTKD